MVLMRSLNLFWIIFFNRNPTPRKVPIDFKPVVGSEINFLDITNKGLLLGVDPHGDTVRFWDELFLNGTYWR